jgi:hypothetical protein
LLARNFVVHRLRFVDAARSPLFPWIAGFGAALITWPLAAIPLITTAVSALFGLGTGLGTRSGVRQLKSGFRQGPKALRT